MDGWMNRRADSLHLRSHSATPRLARSMRSLCNHCNAAGEPPHVTVEERQAGRRQPAHDLVALRRVVQQRHALRARSAGTACGTRRRRARRAGTCCRSAGMRSKADAPAERRVADAAARLRPGVAGAVAVAGGGQHRTLHVESTNAAARRSACRRSLRCPVAAARTRGTPPAADRTYRPARRRKCAWRRPPSARRPRRPNARRPRCAACRSGPRTRRSVRAARVRRARRECRAGGPSSGT